MDVAPVGGKMASVSSDTARSKNVRYPASGKMDYHEHRDRFSEVDGDKQACLLYTSDAADE